MKAIQDNELFMAAIRRDFKGKCSRIDSCEDGLRLRWTKIGDIYITYAGQIFKRFPGKTPQRPLAIFEEIQYLAKNPLLWVTRKEVEHEYYAFDAVVVEIPEGYYPKCYTPEQYAAFDALRPMDRIIGGSQFGRRLAEQLEPMGGNLCIRANMNLHLYTPEINEYLQALRFRSHASADAPFNQPCDDLARTT